MTVTTYKYEYERLPQELKYHLVPKFEKRSDSMLAIQTMMKAFWQSNDPDPKNKICGDINVLFAARWINENGVCLDEFSYFMGSNLSNTDLCHLLPRLTFAFLGHKLNIPRVHQQLLWNQPKNKKISPLKTSESKKKTNLLFCLNKQMHSFSSYKLTVADTKCLTRFTNLKTLELAFEGLIADPNKVLKTEEHLKEIANLTHLTSFNLGYQKQVSYHAFNQLSKLTQLRVLSLGNVEDINICLPNFTHLSNLTSINFNALMQSELSNEGIQYLSHLTKLTSINLNQCEQITDAGIAHLTGLTALVSLDCYDCSIKDRVWKDLIHFTKLSYLNICSKQIKTLDPINHLTNLTSLIPPPNCDDKMLRAIENLTKLENIQLATDSDSDQIIKSACALTNLTQLQLQFFYSLTRKIHSSAFESLTLLKKLNYLDVSDCNIDLNNIRSFSSLTNLATLKIFSAPQIDSQIEYHLSNYLNLKKVFIQHCDTDNFYSGSTYNFYKDGHSMRRNNF